MNRIKLIAGIALLLALLPAAFASASPPINATGTIAFAHLIGETMYPLGQNCILELDIAHVVTGTIEGSCETHNRITVHGPCPAGPGLYRENWLNHAVCTGAVAGREGAFEFHWVAQVDPNSDPDTTGRIVLSGTGDLANLHGVLHLRGSAGTAGTYEGFVHFDPQP
jgi:hypothetical protein